MKSKKASVKTFLLDTNVILHDSSCIFQFKEHDIVIPIAVLEELDHFKRGSQVINLNAREFARTLDTLTGSALFNGGISLGKGRGKVSIAITKSISDYIREIFKEDTADHRILSAALDIKHRKRSDNVIIVTKDVNLRMKAKAVGIHAEDYTTDKIHNVEELYSGKETIENFSHDIIEKLYQPPFEIPVKTSLKKYKTELVPKKFFVLKNESHSVLASLDFQNEKLRKVDKNNVYGIKPRNAEQTFAIDALTNVNIPLVTITGK